MKRVAWRSCRWKKKKKRKKRKGKKLVKQTQLELGEERYFGRRSEREMYINKDIFCVYIMFTSLDANHYYFSLTIFSPALSPCEVRRNMKRKMHVSKRYADLSMPMEWSSPVPSPIPFVPSLLANSGPIPSPLPVEPSSSPEPTDTANAAAGRHVGAAARHGAAAEERFCSD